MITLIVIDNLSGINSMIEHQFENIKIQQCVLHLKRNILRKVKMKHRKEIANDLKHVFDMDNSEDNKIVAYSRSKIFSKKWSKHYPQLEKFSNENATSNYFTYLNFDYQIRRMIYTTNWIERLNKDFKEPPK